MDNPVEYGVGNSIVADDPVPFFRRILACEQDGAVLLASVDDLKKIPVKRALFTVSLFTVSLPKGLYS